MKRQPKTKKKPLNKARQKVIKDLHGQRNESKRMIDEHRSIIWKLRGYSTILEYWIVAFGTPVAILIAIVSQDFWKGLAFYAVTLVYHLSANIRGLTLHIENWIEWEIGKTI